MPVDFLSPAQQENYGKYPNDLTPEFIANYFFLDDEDKKGIWSITVNGNWRITFEFENGDAYIVNYEDYH